MPIMVGYGRTILITTGLARGKGGALKAYNEKLGWVIAV
jgi:hypothetical protein